MCTPYVRHQCRVTDSELISICDAQILVEDNWWYSAAMFYKVSSPHINRNMIIWFAIEHLKLPAR